MNFPPSVFFRNTVIAKQPTIWSKGTQTNVDFTWFCSCPQCGCSITWHCAAESEQINSWFEVWASQQLFCFVCGNISMETPNYIWVHWLSRIKCRFLFVDIDCQPFSYNVEQRNTWSGQSISTSLQRNRVRRPVGYPFCPWGVQTRTIILQIVLQLHLHPGKFESKYNSIPVLWSLEIDLISQLLGGICWRIHPREQQPIEKV